MRNERIGDYLVSQGLINEEQLQKELATQKESNGAKKVGDVVEVEAPIGIVKYEILKIEK